MLNPAQEAEDFEMTVLQLLALTATVYGVMWCVGALFELAFRGIGL